MSSNAIFISLEGIDACGKSTQANNLHNFFLQNNLPCLLTKEPGGSDVGNEIREILLKNRSEPLQKETQLLLNFASRFEHIKKSSNQIYNKISTLFLTDSFIQAMFIKALPWVSIVK